MQIKMQADMDRVNQEVFKWHYTFLLSLPKSCTLATKTLKEAHLCHFILEWHTRDSGLFLAQSSYLH